MSTSPSPSRQRGPTELMEVAAIRLRSVARIHRADSPEVMDTLLRFGREVAEAEARQEQAVARQEPVA